MMHRYWGDWVPDYAEVEGYVPDPVFGHFVPDAMDMADRQLGRIRRSVQADPGTVLVVAASMGQGPIPYRHLDHTFVLDSPSTLLGALGLSQGEPGLAMYPRISFQFGNDEEAAASVAPLRSIAGPGCGAMFRDFMVNGRTVSFEINYDQIGDGMNETLTFHPRQDDSREAPPGQLGIALRPRTGGGNTAYHIPDGILLAYGAGIEPDDSRKPVDILDVGPSLLANVLDVEPAAAMQGTATLFR